MVKSMMQVMQDNLTSINIHRSVIDVDISANTKIIVIPTSHE